jgi:hypothetical protein
MLCHSLHQGYYNFFFFNIMHQYYTHAYLCTNSIRAFAAYTRHTNVYIIYIYIYTYIHTYTHTQRQTHMYSTYCKEESKIKQRHRGMF